MSLDDLQAQLRGTLDQQFAALKQKYEEGIAEARRQADADAAVGREQARAEADARVRSVVVEARAAAERAVADKVGQARAEAETQIRTATEEIRAAAERDVAVKVERARGEFEQARTEWEARLDTVVAAARAEGEQLAAEAAQREREAQEQKLGEAVDQAVAAARRTAELELESERRRAQNEIEAERQKAAAELEAQRQGATTDLEAERQKATTELEAERQKAATAIEDERQKTTTAIEAERQKAATAIEDERQKTTTELEAERLRTTAEIEAARQKAAADVKAVLLKATTGVEVARQKLTAEAEAERLRAQAEIESLRKAMHAEIAAARQAGAASAKGAMPPAAPSGVSVAAFERALAATRDIDAARTLSQALEALLTHAASTAGRAAIFLINGDRLKAWKAAVIPDIDAQTVESSIGARDLLARAIQAGQATSSSAALPAPPFARLPADRGGTAVPLMIAGRAVAVLYVDSGSNAPPVGSAEIVEALVRHTSAIVALRTAMRTLDVLSGASPDGNGSGSSPAGDVTDDQAARRFARLLVSEIKLYNEPAVRLGREQRDLLQRLRAEIDRAQRLYEERVPPAVGGRDVYFQQELVQTLADGDPALLGNA